MENGQLYLEIRGQRVYDPTKVRYRASDVDLDTYRDYEQSVLRRNIRRTDVRKLELSWENIPYIEAQKILQLVKVTRNNENFQVTFSSLENGRRTMTVYPGDRDYELLSTVDGVICSAFNVNLIEV